MTVVVTKMTVIYTKMTVISQKVINGHFGSKKSKMTVMEPK